MIKISQKKIQEHN